MGTMSSNLTGTSGLGYTHNPLPVKGMHDPPEPKLFRSTSHSVLEDWDQHPPGFCFEFEPKFVDRSSWSSSKFPKMNFLAF